MKRTNANLDFIERFHKHGITWALLFVIFFATHPNDNYQLRLISSSAFVGLVMLLVEIVNKVIIPKYLKNQRIVMFVLISSVVVCLWAYASLWIELLLLHFFDQRPIAETYNAFPYTLLVFIIRLLWFVAVVVVAVAFYFQRKENEDKIIADKLKSEKLDMELRYLKSQINPHFLFNALNNIYSMVYMHDDNAADGVLKLSEMLRYVLVDCQADAIPLSKEVKYIENFVDFQLMRFGNDRDVVMEKDIENEGFMIAPMLLQPIVENSFKYSRLDASTDGFVHISITQKGKSFCFVAENSVLNTSIAKGTEKQPGIGQKNVLQRLNLHYGTDYIFDIEQDTDKYKVTIKL